MSLNFFNCAVIALLIPMKAFSFISPSVLVDRNSFALTAHKKDNGINQQQSRSSFISSITTTAAVTLFPPFVQSSFAEGEEVTQEEAASSSSSNTNDEVKQLIVDTPPEPTSPLPPAPPPTTRSIQGCPKPTPGKPSNCVATSNIKQLENYSPPWTFQVSPDEAYARLKGLLKNEPTKYNILELDDNNKYIRVEVTRNFNTIDTMEFLINGPDQVVIFKSSENLNSDGVNSGISDFGSNKKRVDELRVKSNGVFSLMGEGLTADSFDGGKFGKRNGIAGQLKAFYGLQSGSGYESVFEE
jgi:uncharacterized protein (DUF1499 family)